MQGVCKKHNKYQGKNTIFGAVLLMVFAAMFWLFLFSFLGHAALRLCLPDLGLMLGHCGLRQHHIGLMLSHFGVFVVLCWLLLGKSWDHIGLILGHFGICWDILGHVGTILGLCWAILGVFWDLCRPLSWIWAFQCRWIFVHATRLQKTP